MAQDPKPIDPSSDEADDVREEFDDRVNMTAKELRDWLKTDESKEVGQGSGESVGHESGRNIVRILEKKKANLTGEDIAHMKKVNSYVARHVKQPPKKSGEELQQTDWAKSLKNWGHDPSK